MANNGEKVTRSPWLYDVKPFHIVDNVYYVGNKSVSSHLFDTGEGLLLLDTAYLQTTYLLLESIRELGFDPKDIKWVLHSHCHYDHFGATRIIVEKYGAKTYMPAVDIPFLAETPILNLTTRAGYNYEPPYDTYFDVDVPVNDGDVLTFGNTTVKAVAAPGHTPGTMAYFITLPSGLIAAMHGGLGLNTMKTKFINEVNISTQCRADYENTLKKLKGIPVDVVLGNHPGQSETFEKEALVGKVDGNPFVDKTYWDKMLDLRLEKFYEMVASDPIE